MPKVSYEIGLAILGFILTLLLVVLDKGGRLKGPILFWLLALTAFLTWPTKARSDGAYLKEHIRDGNRAQQKSESSAMSQYYFGTNPGADITVNAGGVY